MPVPASPRSRPAYTLGFILLVVVAGVCLLVLQGIGRTRQKPSPQIALKPCRF